MDDNDYKMQRITAFLELEFGTTTPFVILVEQPKVIDKTLPGLLIAANVPDLSRALIVAANLVRTGNVGHGTFGSI